MEIGDKKIVSNEQPYGMFGRSKNKNVKFIELKIIEKRLGVPGEFDGKPCGDGYIAKGSDGYMYAYNYPTYNQGYSNTPWIRYVTDDYFEALPEEEKDKLISDHMWIDVTNYSCPAEPKFIKQFDVEIKYCEKHQRLFYGDCFFCKHDCDEKKGLNIKDHKWAGWY